MVLAVAHPNPSLVVCLFLSPFAVPRRFSLQPSCHLAVVPLSSFSLLSLPPMSRAPCCRLYYMETCSTDVPFAPFAPFLGTFCKPPSELGSGGHPWPMPPRVQILSRSMP